jgi:uncharacterized protein (DUF1810 family)
MDAEVRDESALARFEAAQDAGGSYERALAELRAGRKTSHWIWFVFPQIAGLGRSEMSQKYAISSLAEARAYVRHPLLGARLRECTCALLEHDGVSAEHVLGSVDAMKFRSSMTLFARAAPEQELFGRALEKFFDGVADAATEARL